MMLVERSTVPSEELPVTEFRDHLRLGTGFADDSVQDTVLESYLRASIAAIEARTGKVLITHGYSWTLTRWRDTAVQTLPIAPISAVTLVKLIDMNAVETVVDPATYRLALDSQRPCLRAVGSRLPSIAPMGSVEIQFDAGFSPIWSDIPPDLGQAVFLLAAHYYEHRSALVSGERPMPFGISLLIDRYRSVRLFGEAVR